MTIVDMMTVRAKQLTGLMAMLLVAVSAVRAQQPELKVPADVAKMPFMNPALPTDQRVDDLIKRMTLDEKASQLVNHSRAIPHLGIPVYDWWSEALHGVAFGTATVFPEPIGLASSFDPDAVHQMATVIGIEGRAKYNMALQQDQHRIFQGITFWSPNINIFRDPRWGRGQETYGEDPFLTGRMAVAFVTGMQGDDPKYLRVVSTPKHYAVHSGPEPSRHTIDVPISKHDEEDTYLPAFRAAVVEGKADSVMCVYNSVNGQPGCANDFLLKDQLRSKWGFQGYVVSDCDAVADIERGHHFVKTTAEAAAVSLKAGTDNDCVGARSDTGDSDYVRYVDAVKQGLLTEADIDVSLRRLFTARMRLGMFDPVSMDPYARIPDSENDSPAHRELARKLTRETMVLLKNDGTLPLKPSVKNILVVGPLADQSRVLEGNYHGTASRYVTALDGIKAQFPSANVTFLPGTSFLRNAAAIPAECLSHDGGAGLKGDIYSSADFKGEPTSSRIDPSIDFFRRGGPRTTPQGQPSFVRWTGYLTPTETGDYQVGTFGLLNQLTVDGKVLVDNMGQQPPGNHFGSIHLEAGHKYPLVLDYAGGPSLTVRLIWQRDMANALPEAVEAAKKADVIVGVVGIDSDLEGEEMRVDQPGFLGGDRTSLDMPKQEEDLMEAMKTTGKPLVGVLMNGSALSVNWLAQNANAILEAWYAGEEGGTAIAETLAGANNPSGRLPVTFYKGVDQLPSFEDYAMKNRTYRYFHGEPLYPFGYGLSYSKFAYRNLKLSSTSLAAGKPLTVDLDVANVSGPAGDEVVELYVVPPQIDGNPIRALRGFQRVHVEKGSTAHASITLQPRDLSFVTPAGDRVIAAGKYAVQIGESAPGMDAQVTKDFSISGNAGLPE